MKRDISSILLHLLIVATTIGFTCRLYMYILLSVHVHIRKVQFIILINNTQMTINVQVHSTLIYVYVTYTKSGICL